MLSACASLESDADAQDVMQEAWIRYARADVEDLHNPPAWLTTVVTRLCLDLLRHRRDQAQIFADNYASSGVARGPEDVALLASELAEALTIAFQKPTPPQRVALILHDVFGTPFDEVAHILDSSARLRGLTLGSNPDPVIARRVVSEFLRAAQDGDVDGLVAVLHPDVIRTADPHVLPVGARLKIRGVNAVVAETRALRANAQSAHAVTINGLPGIVVGSTQYPQAALVFVVHDERIVAYDVVADPQRLAVLRIED